MAVDLETTNTVPLPFNVFALTPPTVSSVKPTTVDRGQQFKIRGCGLYPSLVTGVQLGGNILPSGNWTATSDTSIIVVVPSTTTIGNQSIGVKTEDGQSNTNIEINVE